MAAITTRKLFGAPPIYPRPGRSISEITATPEAQQLEMAKVAQIRAARESEGPKTAQNAANGQVVANCWLAFMSEGLNVEKLVKLYCADACQRSKSAHSKTSMRSRARSLLALELARDGDTIALGDMPLAELRLAHCTQLLTRSSAAARTINAQIGLLRTAIRWALATGLWEGTDPTAAVRYRKEPHAERALTDTVIRGLIHGFDVAEAVGAAQLEWIDFPRLLLGIGVRPGDLRSVRTANVDLDRGWLTLIQKGDRELELPYPTSLDPVMRRRVAAAQGRQYLFSGYAPGGHRRSSTRPVSASKVSDLWREGLLPVLDDLKAAREGAGLDAAELADKIGCPVDQVWRWEESGLAGKDSRGRPITLAHFRASNVTTKMRRGLSTKLAGASVGHEEERTTKHYVGPMFEGLEEAAKIMDDYFGQGSPASSTANEPPERVAAANLKRVRVRLKLTQGELGSRVKKSARTIRDWETKGLSDLRQIADLAEALGVDLRELLAGVVA